MKKQSNIQGYIQGYIQKYHEEIYPLHMPGHKQRCRLGDEVYDIDITEVEGTDNLYHPKGIIHSALEKAKVFYNTEETLYLTNGSTGGLLTAIFTMTKPGDKVLVARNCHQAVYHSLELRNLIPVFLYPEEVSIGRYGGFTLDHLKKTLSEHQEIKGLIMTSPTYEGFVMNIKAIKDIVNSEGLWLIVDEAHGAHFPYCQGFPKSALYEGADIIIQSLHKTMPALTPSALLHVNSKRVDKHKLLRYYKMFQTSSPSYVLMSEIERCIDKYSHHESLFMDYINRLAGLKEKLKHMKHLELLDMSNFQGNSVVALDPTKFVISTQRAQVTGIWLSKCLRENYRYQVEMASINHVLAMTSIADEPKMLDKFIEVLLEIDEDISRQHDNKGDKNSFFNGDYFTNSTENIFGIAIKKYEISDALDQQNELIYVENAVGCIAAEYVIPYPPGIPLLIPGEMISKEQVSFLLESIHLGLGINGIEINEGVAQIKIICED